MCAKTEGEMCGGDWNYLGKCDRGLYCKPKSDLTFHKNKIPEGICQRGKITVEMAAMNLSIFVAQERAEA